MSRHAFLALAVLVGLLTAACGTGRDPDERILPATSAPPATTSAPDVINVQLRDLTIVAETAVSAEERGQGLSDRLSLAQNAGMLFFMGEERIPGFHMRNMQFSLDFVWISADGRVVDLAENVLHPAAAGETLSGISPSDPVKYVLEVNAGIVQESGIEIGDQVGFEPDILVNSSTTAP